MKRKNGLTQKRIPTLLALFILFGSVWVTSFLIQSGVITIGGASPDKTPQNVAVTNVTSSSFTVVFTTPNKALSALSVSEKNKAPYLVFDDRNKIRGTKDTYYSHAITVDNLTARTNYKFTIISDGTTYPTDGTSYSTITGAPLPNPTFNKQISGKVINPDGGAAIDTLVTATISQNQELSTLTDNSGNFKLYLKGIRTKDLKAYAKLANSTKITLNFLGQNASSRVDTTVGQATLPTVTLSYQYNFSTQSAPETTSGTSVLNNIAPVIPKPGEIKITTPSQNQSFVDARPLFQGVAIPNKNVKITVEGTTIQTTITSSSNGFWSYRPDVDIGSGAHKIMVQTPDAFGINQSLSANFSVFPSGVQVAENATPSGKTLPTATPTPKPTATPIPTATPTPTVAIATPTPTTTALTPTPTQTQTVTPTPTIVVIPSPSPTLIAVIPTKVPTQPPVVTPAPTGNSSSIVLTLISALLISGGFALLFLL